MLYVLLFLVSSIVEQRHGTHGQASRRVDEVMGLLPRGPSARGVIGYTGVDHSLLARKMLECASFELSFLTIQLQSF